MKVTPKQIAALRYIIAQSRDMCELSKKIAIFLLNHVYEEDPEFSGVGVKFILSPGEEFTEREVQLSLSGFHDVRSSRGSTHLSVIFDAVGIHHFRLFQRQEGESGGWARGSGCFAFCDTDKWSEVEEIFVSREQIEAIDILRPGLYPESEPIRISED